MAPMADDVYFPPLDKCLKDQTLLLSWKDVYTSLQDSVAELPPGVHRFLDDPESLKLLKRPLKPFDIPSAGTKSRFEHLTAAINITPDDSASYNLTEIKEDALWLSKQIKVDEVIALRIAVLEWQKRPSLSLLARPLDAETKIDDAEVADSALNQSMFVKSTANGDSNTDTQKAVSEQQQLQRRARLVALYHTEKTYVLATSRLIFSARRTLWITGQTSQAILNKLGVEIETSFLPRRDGSVFVQQAVDSIKAALETADGFGELLELLGDEQALRTQLNDLLLLEIVTTLETITLVSDSSEKVLSVDAVQPFFQLMLDTGFFTPIITSALEGSPTLATLLQLNLSTASLAILKLPAALEFIRPDYKDEDVMNAPETRGFYVCNRSCLKTLQDAFVVFAEHGCNASAFAIFAWVILVSNLQIFAQQSGAIETDEDTDGLTDSLIRRNHWRTDTLNEGFLEIISPAESLGEIMTPLAQCATSHLAVFQQMSTVVSALDKFYGERMLRTFAETTRNILFDLFQQSGPLIQYTSETLGAFLSIIGGDRSYWHLVDRETTQLDTVIEFVADGLEDGFKDYFGEMRYRYPREMGPFHQLLRALFLNCKTNEGRVQDLMEYITHAESFMLKLPPGFSGYREDPASVEFEGDEIPYKLVERVPFFHSQRAGLSFSSQLAITDGGMGDDEDERSETCLPVGSVGSLVASGRPPVICFNKHFSPLRYMIGCLCTVIPGNDFVDVSTGAPVPLDDIVDILGLLSTVLLATHKAGIPYGDGGVSILDETYIEAEPQRNLLEIVAELFEAQLAAVSVAGTQEGSLDVLVQCIQFFHAVALTHPARLWPILARSKLLEIDGRGGYLAAIVAAVEMVEGRYDLLAACIRLFEALADASLWPGAATSPSEGRALTRFSDRRGIRAGAEPLPQRMAAVVITCFTKTLLEVFTSSRSWRYIDLRDRAEISANLAASFEKVLKYVYGFDDAVDVHQKAVVSVLAEAGETIKEVLLKQSVAQGLSDALIDMLSDAVSSLKRSVFAIFGRMSKKEANSAISLINAAVCIRAAKVDTSLSGLEQHIYRSTPILVRLFAGYEGFKAPVSDLIQRLTNAAAIADTGSMAPSLLGSLSPSSAKDFLAVLGHLDLPYEDVHTERKLWGMLSAIVSSNQQWLAICLLTGKIPKDSKRLQSKDQPSNRTVSLFSSALNQLSEVSLVEGRPVWRRLPPELALEMLRFVASCQNHWAWAVSELRSHPKFIDAIAKNYIRHLHREPTDTTMSLTNEAAIAATISEILAMYLYSSAQLGDLDAAAKKIIDHLQYFERFGVAAPKYNDSLHKNLKANLEKQHKGLRLENFKHTLTFPTHFGGNYFYDVPFASRVLNVRRSAKSKLLKGLEQHLKEANEDLSYVDAQISLLRGWKLLAAELAKTVKPDTTLSAMLIDVVGHCLEENAQSTVPQAIFEKLRFQRLELALNLLQKLVTLDLKDVEQVNKLRKLFSTTWDTIRTSGFDFDTAYAGGDVSYYRALLQILFLTLKPLTKATPNSKRDATSHQPLQANELIEVLVYIVIKGFKSLTAVLHEDMTRALPGDFVLLTAMLQIILKIPGIDLLFSQFSLHFANNNTSLNATSLFSWSDQFLLDGDPIYGELAILFLLEMSSIPPVAETLAVDGVLSQLASAKIMRLYTRAKGMGPFDNPTRLHSIWSRGILPLCLNLLDAVGAPVAAEVVSFLNTFPAQLNRLGTELANRNSPVGTRPNDSHISLSLASETHSLSLLWLVVERYRAAGVASGTLVAELPRLEWDERSVKDDVDDFVMGRSNLGPLVVPANEREAELIRLRPLDTTSKANSRLEEKIMAEFRAASECLKADAA
ncbi:uncharacterized protein PV09_08240 [Verruconis gallopava]|uniref:Uncharacterized protein n=1 Tax=Verruconis gallopava TaxID=253628 RepID=A0A0D2A1J5_9PEZI|nr:uncharacterized protein PV09_08240 [Verruconis gallopava]KIW00200.1 hypothetical protein PV09_08240 [Verruconis gallopava]